MSGRTTSRWTDAHVMVATLSCATLATGLLAALEPGVTRLAVAGVGALAMAVGLLADISVAAGTINY